MTSDPLANLRIEFRRRAARDRAALIESLAAGDIGQVECIAHGLAGSAGMFGFADVAEAALAIDEGFATGRGLNADAADRLVAGLKALDEPSRNQC
jgi:HPt (histidine-containing phosphotransfer) domain-containing protein